MKTAEIKRLKNLLNDAFKYTKYYNNLETTQFEELEDLMMKSWKKMSIWCMSMMLIERTKI
jgi:hypothetical protein